MTGPWWSVVSRSTSLTAAPVLQVAADGQWETAQVVTGAPARARTVVEQVARAARDDVAVEILWPGQAFVGVRWPAESWAEAAAAVSRSSPRRTLEAGLLALLGTTPGSDLEFVELGAVNAWRSMGPEPLWRPGDRRAERLIGPALTRRPDLATCAHPLAVELAVTTPRPCWVGLYLSIGSVEDVLAAVI